MPNELSKFIVRDIRFNSSINKPFVKFHRKLRLSSLYHIQLNKLQTEKLFSIIESELKKKIQTKYLSWILTYFEASKNLAHETD